jgi:anti-anti-sigma regulatory factor
MPDPSLADLLLALHAEASARERKMVLQRPSPAAEKVLRICGVYDLFTVEDEA